MTHEEAIRDLAVEKYLLQEMPEETRTAFEEHFFACVECAEDLVAGRLLLDAGKLTVEESPAPKLSPSRSWRDRFFSNWVLVPALAAALLVIVYQSGVLVPDLHRKLAKLDAPELVTSVVLANMNARGTDVPSIVAPASGSFVLAVDIPAREGTSTYLCSLLNDAGKVEWTVDVPPERIDNTIMLRVPADQVQAGRNTLLVRAKPASGESPAELGRYVFAFHR